MTIQGIEVDRAMAQAALRALFDAVPKGKFRTIVRQASVVEAVIQKGFDLDRDYQDLIQKCMDMNPKPKGE